MGINLETQRWECYRAILQDSEAGIMGLAIICSVANDDYDNYSCAIEEFVTIRKMYYSQKDYSCLFQQYLEVRNGFIT